MSSTANLQTDTLGVQLEPPDVRRRASLTLADQADNAAELLQWLDMLGLPPCERHLRSSKAIKTGSAKQSANLTPTSDNRTPGGTP
jgi:hypothetical protein